MNDKVIVLDNIEVKRCKQCGFCFTMDKYYFDKKNNRYESMCKDCKGKFVKAYRNPETYPLHQKIWNLTYKVKMLEQKLKNND